jgi:hypothetical protein
LHRKQLSAIVHAQAPRSLWSHRLKERDPDQVRLSRHEFIYQNGRINGMRILKEDGLHEPRCRSVILACGGLEANAEIQARYPAGI